MGLQTFPGATKEEVCTQSTNPSKIENEINKLMKVPKTKQKYAALTFDYNQFQL